MRKVLPILTALIVCLVVQTSSAKIVHRWSFDKDTAEPINNAHAKLEDGAAVKEGQVDLDGESKWVSLPIGRTIEKLTSVTIETWFTCDDVSKTWSRVFDFGNSTSANMFLTVRSGRAEQGAPAGTPRFAITKAGLGQEEQLNGKEPLAAGKLTHIAITIDAEKHVGKMYINGKEVASREMNQTPSDLGETKLNFVGVSQYTEADPLFKGSVTEFRIYDNPLTADEIEQSFKAGPDKLATKPEGEGKAADGKVAPATAGEEKKSGDKTEGGK